MQLFGRWGTSRSVATMAVVMESNAMRWLVAYPKNAQAFENWRFGRRGAFIRAP